MRVLSLSAMTMIATLRRWFGARSSAEIAAAELYRAAVALARQSALYERFGVPDTLDGRFEMLILHVHLICRRLARCGAGGGAVAQALFDTMFADFDRNLRELGVSDPSLPKRIREMVEAYYGRAKTYEAALAEGPAALKDALLRNVYANRGDDAAAAQLAAYTASICRTLDEASDKAMSGGQFHFVLIDGGAPRDDSRKA
jgi:cytochrome b pre-mRNA-processing protein 3